MGVPGPVCVSCKYSLDRRWRSCSGSSGVHALSPSVDRRPLTHPGTALVRGAECWGQQGPGVQGAEQNQPCWGVRTQTGLGVQPSRGQTAAPLARCGSRLAAALPQPVGLRVRWWLPGAPALQDGVASRGPGSPPLRLSARASRCRGQCGSVWAAPSAWSLTRAWGLDVEASARRSPRCLQGGRVDPSATSLAARACCRAVCLSGPGLHGVAANACPGLLVAAWGTGASASLWPDSADPPEAC